MNPTLYTSLTVSDRLSLDTHHPHADICMLQHHEPLPAPTSGHRDRGREYGWQEWQEQLYALYIEH